MNDRMMEIKERLDDITEDGQIKFEHWAAEDIYYLLSKVRALEDLVGKKDEALEKCHDETDCDGCFISEALALRVEDEKSAKEAKP